MLKPTKDTKVLYAELSYQVTGALFKVHNFIGRFEKEHRYGDALQTELISSGIAHEREKKLSTGDYVDFLIENKIILELKAKRIVGKADIYQVQRYLRASNMNLGCL